MVDAFPYNFVELKFTEAQSSMFAHTRQKQGHLRHTLCSIMQPQMAQSNGL